MLVGQLILIQGVTFVLIILFLRRLLYSQTSRALKRLQQLNQQNLEKGKVLREELERAKKQIKVEIEEGKKEGENIKEKAVQSAEKETRKILETAQKEAKRIIKEAEEDNQRKSKDLRLQMQDKTVYLAMDIVKYIFTEQGRRNLQNQFVDELISEMENIQIENEKMGDCSDNNVEMISAYPLDEEQKQRVKQILCSKLNKEINLDEQVNTEIIAGLVIKLGGFIIDGSIKNKFKKVMPLMKEKVKQL